MGIIAFLILGTIAGVVARALVPGRIGGGLIPALLLGVGGSMVGGWLSSAIFHVSFNSFWDPRTWVTAIAGSALVLIVWGLLTGRAKSK